MEPEPFNADLPWQHEDVALVFPQELRGSGPVQRVALDGSVHPTILGVPPAPQREGDQTFPRLIDLALRCGCACWG
jgi:hypothetical protein